MTKLVTLNTLKVGECFMMEVGSGPYLILGSAQNVGVATSYGTSFFLSKTKKVTQIPQADFLAEEEWEQLAYDRSHTKIPF